jgi:hypothetical protein
MSQSQCLKKNNSIYCHINIFKKLISSNIYYILNLLLTVLLKKKHVINIWIVFYVK